METVSPSARRSSWQVVPLGRGGCRRRRRPGELVSDTFSPMGRTRGLAALVHTCTPSTHSPHAHRRRRVRERLAGGPKLQEAGACLQAAHPAPRAEYSHFLKSESPPGESEPPEGTRQAHRAMQRPQQPCVTKEVGPGCRFPGGLRAEAEEGQAERRKQLSGLQAGVQTPTDAPPGAPLLRASLSVAPALFHLPSC